MRVDRRRRTRVRGKSSPPRIRAPGLWVVRLGWDDGDLRPWHYKYEYIIEKSQSNEICRPLLPSLPTWFRVEGLGDVSAPCLMFRVQGSGFSILGFRVSGFGSRGLGFGFRVSGFGIRISGFRIRVSGFGFRDSGFGFRDSGFGIRISG